MKKQLIALAVIGTMTAPMIAQADATLYGSFRFGIADTSNTGPAGSKTDGDLDLVDTSSRIGIKGTVDLGLDSTEGFFNVEWGVNGVDETESDVKIDNRLMLIGMRGDWGQFILGKQYLPHYLWINSNTDVFQPESREYGERFYLGNIRPGGGTGDSFLKRTEGAVTYFSPVVNGLQFVGGVVLLGQDDDSDDVIDEDVDAYNVALRYAANAFSAAISYGDIETVNTPGAEVEKDALGFAVKYQANGLELMGRYEESETSIGGSNTEDEDVIEVAARYTMNSTAYYVRVSEYDNKIGDLDLTQWGIGISHKMGKGIVYLEHINNDSDDTFGDRSIAGYRLDF
ncbi:MAG: porin [Motiliproteus sp.]|nr:porin [Motiliproteus sp.]MCW9051606.1 porin [Motiliproteus sp.]